MPVVNVELGERSYPVLIENGLLQSSDAWRQYIPGKKVFIITNEIVAPLYLERVSSALTDIETDSLVLPDGESQKTMSNWSRIIDHLVKSRAGRDSCLLALGGGVIGDISGFSAATYMRGIPFIQVPTTLLAQVDASVGGKTAINHPLGKNLIGAFHQPSAVVVDIATLGTLPDREFRAGLAEIVKCGAIRDARFMDWMEQNSGLILAREPQCLLDLVERSIRHKAEVVARDELESGERALLNFGHTFAHALEALTGFSELLHGEAVSIGMVVASRLSETRALCPTGTAARIRSLLLKLGLPVAVPAGISPSRILESMTLDKKNLQGLSRLILLRELGDAVIDSSSTDKEIATALVSCQ